ncbi:MAG: DUF1738 domain-containing protein, partial [Planctomycetes bacterium]|nr:DUF1738 domain-containing protein [Planctomycetota bacterium]
MPKYKVSREAAKQKQTELIAKLETGVKDLRGSEQYKAFLDSASKFHAYSFGNIMLINLQYPSASRVAGYRAWQALGRQVRKGEKGIAIMAPRPFKDHADGCARGRCECPQAGVGFTSVSVFDVAQTEGDDL